jgi:hypothetical protein
VCVCVYIYIYILRVTYIYISLQIKRQYLLLFQSFSFLYFAVEHELYIPGNALKLSAMLGESTFYFLI